ncbi:hypothetical protein KQX54_001469 [Cotesia glomerata]|uniref:H15 domain-containing protein n=1 Tax=Cotesia glomerata TaxID=32391 RepID=A0AAV7HWM8_COTGL|nr:hypothetical protein KQX54_001469 [Cotesia glomerata]
MSKKLSTTLTLAVTALKNLEERKGASPHDICNYISSVYNVPKDVAKRKALVALKRGTSYGLLKETSGRYNLLTDTEKECLELTNQELGLLNLNCRKRRLERKRRLRGSSKQQTVNRVVEKGIRIRRKKRKKEKVLVKRGLNAVEVKEVKEVKVVFVHPVEIADLENLNPEVPHVLEKRDPKAIQGDQDPGNPKERELPKALIN